MAGSSEGLSMPRMRPRLEEGSHEAHIDCRLKELESNFQRLAIEGLRNSMQLETMSNPTTTRSKEDNSMRSELEQLRIELGQWQVSMKEMLADECKMIRDSISHRGPWTIEPETEVWQRVMTPASPQSMDTEQRPGANNCAEDMKPMVSAPGPAQYADTVRKEAGSPDAQDQQLILLQEILQRLPRLRRSHTTSVRTESMAREQAARVRVDLGSMRFRSDALFGRRSSVPSSVAKPPQTRLQQIVNGYRFNIFYAALILANAVLIGYKASEDVQRAIHGNAETSDWFKPVEIAFAVCFGLELILRISAERTNFFFGREKVWNLFDLIVVLLSVGQLFLSAEGWSFGFLRIVRATRLVRVARIIRVVRFFRDLRIMMESVMVSFTSLFWAFVLMALTIYIFSVAFLGAAADYLDAEEPKHASTVAALKTWFSDLPQAMLTLLMSFTGGQDWWEFADAWRSVGPGYMCLFVLYVLFMSFGMMNVLTAFFVDSATRMSEFDKQLVIEAKMDQEASTVESLKELFSELDTKGDGTITLDQFERLLAKDNVRNHFSHLEIEPSEVGTFFKLLDTCGNGRITIEEFVSGCIRIKGGAREVDLATLLYENKVMSQHWSASMQVLEEVLRDILARLKDGLVWEAPLLSAAQVPAPPEAQKMVSQLESDDHTRQVV